MILPLIVIAVAAAFAGGSTPEPCPAEVLNCDSGTRATGGAVARPAGPSEHHNAGPGGGQVSQPSKPNHGPKGKPHGKPGKGGAK